MARCASAISTVVPWRLLNAWFSEMEPNRKALTSPWRGYRITAGRYQMAENENKIIHLNVEQPYLDEFSSKTLVNRLARIEGHDLLGLISIDFYGFPLEIWTYVSLLLIVEKLSPSTRTSHVRGRVL